MLACPVPPPRQAVPVAKEKGPPFDNPAEELEYCAALAARIRRNSLTDLYAQMPPAGPEEVWTPQPEPELAGMALARDGP